MCDFIMIMIKIPVKAQPVYRISIKYYCIIDNSTCSETNNLVSLSFSVSFVGHINNQDLLLLDMETVSIISIHYFQLTTSRILFLSLLSLGFGSGDNTIPPNDNISFPSSYSRFQLFNQQLVSSLFSLGHVCRHEYILIWRRIKDFESILALISQLPKRIKRGLCFLSIFFPR